MTPARWQLAGGAVMSAVLFVLVLVWGESVAVGFALGSLISVWFLEWEERAEAETPELEGTQPQ